MQNIWIVSVFFVMSKFFMDCKEIWISPRYSWKSEGLRLWPLFAHTQCVDMKHSCSWSKHTTFCIIDIHAVRKWFPPELSTASGDAFSWVLSLSLRNDKEFSRTENSWAANHCNYFVSSQDRAAKCEITLTRSRHFGSKSIWTSVSLCTFVSKQSKEGRKGYTEIP